MTQTTEFTLGDYNFFRRDDLPRGDLFMQHKDGEGTQISEWQINKALSSFFNEVM